MNRFGMVVECEKKDQQMTLADATPGQWLEIDGQDGLYLVVWNETGKGIVGTDDSFIQPIKRHMHKAACRVVDAVVRVRA